MSSALKGTFQDYYESTLLPSSSSASISLIGSLQVFFLYGFGPLTGRTFDAYGTSVCLSGVVLHVIYVSGWNCELLLIA